MKFNLLLPACLTICMLCQCRKDADPVLPPITTEGKNTIGFTIDDKIYVPYRKCCSGWGRSCKELEVHYGSPGAIPGAIQFEFERSDGSRSFQLTIYSAMYSTITSTGNKVDSIAVFFESPEKFGTLNGKFGYPQPGSKFEITRLDTVNKIISGEFELILSDYDKSPKEIHIKQGRFDFKYPAITCR